MGCFLAFCSLVGSRCCSLASKLNGATPQCRDCSGQVRGSRDKICSVGDPGSVRRVCMGREADEHVKASSR